MDPTGPDAPGGHGRPAGGPPTALIDSWLGVLAALVIAGPGIGLAVFPTLAPAGRVGFGAAGTAAGVLLLLAVPLAAAWASRRLDWQAAGLRAIGAGLLVGAATVPLVGVATAAVGAAGPAMPWVLAAGGGLGAAVAAALRPTSRWSLPARALAVVVVLLAPVGVLAAGEALGPRPAGVARALWLAAPLGVVAMVGLADSLAHALAGRATRRRAGGP